MKLREWDYDAQRFVEVDYSDAPIAEFVNFFRTTKAWVDDPERVNRRVLVLDKALAAERQERREAQAATAENMTGRPAAQATLEDVLAAARNGSAPEWLRMCAEEIHRLRALVVTPKKGGQRAAHAEG